MQESTKIVTEVKDNILAITETEEARRRKREKSSWAAAVELLKIKVVFNRLEITKPFAPLPNPLTASLSYRRKWKQKEREALQARFNATPTWRKLQAIKTMRKLRLEGSNRLLRRVQDRKFWVESNP